MQGAAQAVAHIVSGEQARSFSERLGADLPSINSCFAIHAEIGSRQTGTECVAWLGVGTCWSLGTARLGVI